jgi:hypothetical protein
MLTYSELIKSLEESEKRQTGAEKRASKIQRKKDKKDPKKVKAKKLYLKKRAKGLKSGAIKVDPKRKRDAEKRAKRN